MLKKVVLFLDLIIYYKKGQGGIFEMLVGLFCITKK